jgi:ABC-type xylose transport system permease subunit
MADKPEKIAISISILLLIAFVFLQMRTNTHLIKPQQYLNGNKISYIKQAPHNFVLPNYLPLSSKKGCIPYFIYFGINMVLLVVLLYLVKFKEMGRKPKTENEYKKLIRKVP